MHQPYEKDRDDEGNSISSVVMEYPSVFQFSRDNPQEEKGDGKEKGERGEVTEEAPLVRGGMPIVFGKDGKQRTLFVPGGLFLSAKYNNSLNTQYAAAASELAKIALGGNVTGKAEGVNDDLALRTAVPDVDVIPDNVHASLIGSASVPTPDDFLVAASLNPRQKTKKNSNGTNRI